MATLKDVQRWYDLLEGSPKEQDRLLKKYLRRAYDKAVHLNQHVTDLENENTILYMKGRAVVITCWVLGFMQIVSLFTIMYLAFK